MGKTVDVCNKRVDPQSAASTSTAALNLPLYDEYQHRAILVLRCARNHRPFNIVKDKEYQMEVELLRPGTRIPTAEQISRDTRLLYQSASIRVREYFSVSLFRLISGANLH